MFKVFSISSLYQKAGQGEGKRTEFLGVISITNHQICVNYLKGKTGSLSTGISTLTVGKKSARCLFIELTI